MQVFGVAYVVCSRSPNMKTAYYWLTTLKEYVTPVLFENN